MEDENLEKASWWHKPTCHWDSILGQLAIGGLGGCINKHVRSPFSIACCVRCAALNRQYTSTTGPAWQPQTQAHRTTLPPVCVCVWLATISSSSTRTGLLARFSHLTAETGQGNAIHQMTAADNDAVWKKGGERSFLDGNAGYWWWMKWNESRHSGEKKITLCQKEVDELSRAQLFDRDSSFACVLVPGGPHLVPNFFLAICTLWQRRLRASLSYTIRRRLSWAHKSPISTGWLEYVAEQTSPCQWIEWGRVPSRPKLGEGGCQQRTRTWFASGFRKADCSNHYHKNSTEFLPRCLQVYSVLPFLLLRSTGLGLSALNLTAQATQ